jgi:SAM-dependent methyltransferase
MRLLFFLFLVSLTFGQEMHHGRGHGGGHHHSAERYARFLENDKRAGWQKPEQVVSALKLKQGERIADIGAGTGYFSRRFAAEGASVFAVDVDPKLLDEYWKGGENHITTVLEGYEDPKLEKASMDSVFFCNVAHHIENREPYYSAVSEALKPDGRVIVLDFYDKPLPIGPGEKMKISRDEMIAEWKEAGFRLREEFDFLPYQYFLVFEKAR